MAEAKLRYRFEERVVEEIATRLFAAEELSRVAEKDFARGDIHRNYWRYRRDQAESNRIILWAVARNLGRHIDRAVDERLEELRGA